MALTKLNNQSLNAVTSAGLPSGTVLQVVNSAYATEESSTNTSYVASNGITATITPTSTSSKIFVQMNFLVQSSTNDGRFYATIYRGSTNLGSGSNSALGYYHPVDRQGLVNLQLQFMDSPNSTSALVYKLYYKQGNSGTLQIRGDIAPSSVTLMEIAG